MTIDVSPDVEASIRRKVESGRYDDASDVIRTALRLLDDREQRTERLRASIAEGLAAIERGEGFEWTPDLMEEIDREAEALARLNRLRAGIAIGDEQIARGEVGTWTSDFMERLMREAIERSRRGLPVRDVVQP